MNIYILVQKDVIFNCKDIGDAHRFIYAEVKEGIRPLQIRSRGLAGEEMLELAWRGLSIRKHANVREFDALRFKLNAASLSVFAFIL